MKKKLTWTKHLFYCTNCQTTNRAAQEMIDHDRECGEPDSTDEEVVNCFSICLECGGFGDDHDLTGERVLDRHK